MKLLNTFIGLALGASIAMQGQAQEEQFIKPASKKAEEINASAQQSQQTIDNISGQIEDKLLQYKTLMKEIDGLEVYTNQLQKQLDNQAQEMVNLNASIDEVSVIERQITPLMIRMIEGLAQFIQLDVPFLNEERAKRIADLTSMMEQANIAPSEKFRRVMEAFQVEMDYGRTIEAYSGLHLIDGQQRDVEFLRIGRTALIYQTRDASIQGAWNKQTRDWDDLDASYRSQISKGLRIAKKQLAPDLLVVPVTITD
jgi:DNA repair exonuclease SbcCD ATPase subunit